MTENGYSRFETAQPVPVVKRENETKSPELSPAMNLQKTLPALWGKEASPFCDWCGSNGEAAGVESIISICLRKGETERLKGFVELTECPSDPKEFPSFLKSFKNEFADVKSETEKTQTATEKTQKLSTETQQVTEKTQLSEKQIQLLESVKERLKKDYGALYQEMLAGKEETPKNLHEIFNNPENRKKLFAAAKANDEKTGGNDAVFFAEKFRSLGIINHVEFRELFEKGTEKSGEGEKKPFAGRTELALAEGFRKADSHPPTFVSFDRKDEKGRIFDEILKLGADGKSGTKEIVSPQSGYSLEVPLIETREEALAEKESAVGTIQEKTQRVEGRAKWVEKTFGTIPKDGEFPKEALHALKELATAANLPPVDEKNPRETLAKVKETLKTEYEASKNELASARAALAKTAAELAEAKARQGKDSLKSEENAREIIAFLDETGMTAFGRTNTELLLKKFQSDTAAAGAKITLQNGNPDVREGFSETAKTALYRAFVRQVEETLGETVFDTESKKLLAGVNLAQKFVDVGRYDHASGKVDWEKSA